LIVDDDFIYEDEEEDEPDIDVENGYYNAKGRVHNFRFTDSQPSKRMTQKKPSMNSVSSSKPNPQQVKKAIGTSRLYPHKLMMVGGSNP